MMGALLVLGLVGSDPAMAAVRHRTHTYWLRAGGQTWLITEPPASPRSPAARPASPRSTRSTSAARHAARKPAPAATAVPAPIRLPAYLMLARRAMTPAGVMATETGVLVATSPPALLTPPIGAAPLMRAIPAAPAPYAGPALTPTAMVAAGVSLAIPGGGQLIEGSPGLATVFAAIEAAAIAGLWAGSAGGSLPLWTAGAGLLVANHLGATSEIFYSGRSAIPAP